MSAARIVLVEDDGGYREALELLVGATEGMELAASFADAEQLQRALDEGEVAHWTLVLMDINLPRADGIEACAALKRAAPDVLVVMVTVLDDTDAILRAICAGADGYLAKSARADEIVAGVRAVLAGGSGLTPGVARKVLDLARPRAGQTHAPVLDTPLSPRQLDVLRLLVEGRIYKEVADDLGISVDTVRTHIRGLYRRLQVNTVAEAVAKALRAGLV